MGPKTAAKWLDLYGSLDEVIAHSDAVKGKIGDNLRDCVDTLPLSRELATIRCDVDFGVGISDLTPRPPDEDRLREYFEHYEFKPWLEELGGGPAKAVPSEPLVVAVISTRTDLDGFLERARVAGALTLAIETTPGRFMDREPAGVALCVETGDAAYVPVGHDHLGAPTQLSWSDFLESAGAVLEDAAVTKTGQDLKHASNILARFGIELAGVGNDTMLESYVLDSVGARRHALEDVAQKYLGREVPSYETLAGKGTKQRPMNQVEVQDAADYAGARVELATQLHATLRPRLDSTGRLAEVYDEIDRPLLGVLGRMERLRCPGRCGPAGGTQPRACPGHGGT